MKKFEVGRIYWCRSVCDYQSIWNYEVVRRTEKSVWIKRVGQKNEHAKPCAKRKTVKDWDGKEYINPEGRYSMAPMLTAEKVEPATEKQGELI